MKNDVLGVKEIHENLHKKYKDYPIEVYKVLDSTNVELKRRAVNGAVHGLTILSEEQTAGKGRMGRDFYSPNGTGIYMSIMIKPEMIGEDVVLITTAASVAVCRALEKSLGMSARIKWVNDIYLNERKICGILTEAITDTGKGRIESVILGIGINYRTENFPQEIRGIAGSLLPDCAVPRNLVVGAILNEFWEIYEKLAEREFMKEYRKRSNVIGKEVRFLVDGEWETANALDVDDDGGLIVEVFKEDGMKQKQVLRTGEITLRITE